LRGSRTRSACRKSGRRVRRLFLEFPIEVGVLLVDLGRIMCFDAGYPQLGHLRGHLQPLFQGSLRYEPVVEAPSSRGEVPNPHREAELELFTEVLQHLVRVPSQALAAEVGESIGHGSFPSLKASSPCAQTNPDPGEAVAGSRKRKPTVESARALAGAPVRGLGRRLEGCWRSGGPPGTERCPSPPGGRKIRYTGKAIQVQ